MSLPETLTDDPVALPPREPRVWKFWGTSLWGLLIFIALFLGQGATIVILLLMQKEPLTMSTFASSLTHVVTGGKALSLSVMTGLPGVLLAIWLATKLARQRFADYLALNRPSWKWLLIGAVSLAVLVEGWDLLSKATGREVMPGFMMDTLKAAQADNTLWLLVLAIVVAAPVTEEFFVRGFLYRGWSESFLRIPGAIILSSAVWTMMHLQYDWFFLGEVFSIGLLLGYLRYRSNSTWLTVVIHGLNNLAATIQTIWLASHS
ncbi:CPBP family intramembrane metalloprotease [[Pseudomonas] carboxydohydrogena]|uniref:CPBP family intramembrane metalloprotease n=1 Tax=Afipia carboxydohydrogena TaxID=290 RepID=A0ABY8BSH3_AFICR|nr:type II CAAX endopeptidase family protein [[Pseudomonas] carboxydohydrogena]WEF52928.1 CPBP family intramembrane metalloprotease [[Pseudomonas] carboxydohydrogena]